MLDWNLNAPLREAPQISFYENSFNKNLKYICEEILLILFSQWK